MCSFRCIVLLLSFDVALGLSATQAKVSPTGAVYEKADSSPGMVEEKPGSSLMRRDVPPVVGLKVSEKLSVKHPTSHADHNLTLGPVTRKLPQRRMCPYDPLTGFCKLKKHRDMKCTSLARKATNPVKAIPDQLIVTGPPESMEEIKPELKANVERVLHTNPQLKLRYLGDGACSTYIREKFRYLAEHYDNEPKGEFRGDICRTVVLFHEGGYYMDLDLDLRTPLSELVDNQTTFVSAFSMTNAQARQRMYGGSMLNALMIAVPKSKVLASTLYHMISWYKGDPSVPWGRTGAIYVGTLTLWRGLAAVLACNCPQQRNLDKLWFLMKNQTNEVPVQWSCGQDNIRLYQEKRLQCKTVSPECPVERANNSFDLVHYGIFEPGPARNLIAWSRPSWCTVLGCNSGGHNLTGVRGAVGWSLLGQKKEPETPLIRSPI